MSEVSNPYIAGTPLRKESGFFGREDLLAYTTGELRNRGTNAILLFGQRRVGKTSLLRKLERTLDSEEFLPVYFDLQDQAARPLGKVLADLADTLAEAVGLELPEPDDFDDQGNFFRKQFLPHVQEALGDRRLVLLLDEFDVLEQTAESELPEIVAAKSFFPFLRKLLNEDLHVAFVFVIGRRAEDLSTDFSSTFKGSTTKEVWVLAKIDAESLIRQAEENNSLRFTDGAIERILSLTGGHAYFTQLLCQRIWQQAYGAGNQEEVPLIDEVVVDHAVPDALESGDAAIHWLWDGLTPAEKIFAAAFAQVDEDTESTISEDHVIQEIANYAARLRTSDVERAPQYLVQRRVLEEADSAGKYNFAIELFRLWVKQKKRLQDVKDELDKVNPLANQLYLTGKQYFDDKKWAEAARFFKDALVANPDHFNARLELGEALLAQGQIDDAVVELEVAYNLDRDKTRLPLARALVEQAKAAEQTDDEEKALATADKALAVSPKETEAQQIKTAIWLRRGDAARRSSEAAQRQGQLQQAQRELEAAIHAYEQADVSEQVTSLRPQLQVLTWQNEAHLAVEEARWEKAAEIYERLLEKFPDDPHQTEWQAALKSAQEEAGLSHHFERGVTYLNQKAWKAAQQEFAVIIQQEPGYEQEEQSATSLLTQAKLEEEAENHVQARRWQDGIAAYQNLLGLFPNHPTRKEAWEAALSQCQEGSELATLFDAGVESLRQDDLENAQSKLSAVSERRADYERNGRKVAELLQEIHHKVDIRTTLEADSQWEAAITAYQKLHNQATHEEEKRAWQAEIERCQREDEIAGLFAAGLGHLDQGEWLQAQRAFAEVIHYRPDYRREGQTASQLLDQAVSQTKIDLSQRFQEGVTYMEQQEWPQAQRAFADVVHQQPDFRQDGQSAGQLLELALAEGRLRKEKTPWRTWLLALFLVGILGILFGSFFLNDFVQPQSENTLLEPDEITVVTAVVTTTPGTPMVITRSEIQTVEATVPFEVTRIVEETVMVSVPLDIVETPESPILSPSSNVPITGQLDKVEPHSIPLHVGNQANAIAFAPLQKLDLLAVSTSTGVELYAPMPGENRSGNVDYSWKRVANVSEEIASAKVNKLAFTRWEEDSLLLAAALDSGEIKVWDVSADSFELSPHNASTSMRYAGNNEVISLSFSPDGLVLASVEQGGDIKLWCMNDNSEIPFAAPSIGENGKVVFYPEFIETNGEETFSAVLVSSGDNDSTGTIKFWRIDILDTTICRVADVDDPEIRTNIAPLNTTIHDLTLTVDGSILAAATEDEGVFLWKRDNNNELALAFLPPPMNIELEIPVHSVDFLSSEQSSDPILVTGSGSDTETTGGTIQTWLVNNSTDQPLQIINNPLPVTNVAFSPNWPIIAYTMQNSVFRLRHANIQQIVEQIPDALHMTYAPNKGLLAIRFANDNIQIKNLDGRQVATLALDRSSEQENDDSHLLFYDNIADNCDTVLAATTGNTIQLWQLDGDKFNSFNNPVSVENAIKSLDFTCHNGNLYLAAGADNATIKLWHLQNLEVNETLPDGIFQPDLNNVGEASVNSVRLTSDGQELILVAGFNPGYTPRRWFLGTSSTVTDTQGLSPTIVREIAMSQNANTIAILTEENIVQRWQEEEGLQSLNELSDLDDDQPVKLIALNNGDVLVVAGSSSDSIQVWDSNSGQMKRLNGLSGEIVDVFVTSDATAIFSLAKDGNIVLWRIEETQ